MTAEQILDELSQASGTEHYYQYVNIFNQKIFVYTDGIKNMAELCGAYWLIDCVASYQYGKVKQVPFQVWTLKKHVFKTGKRAGQWEWKLEATDGNSIVMVWQTIEYSDFPLDSIKMYLSNGVLLLPSEY